MIIVTGGAGFIGSHVVRELNKAGIDDIVIVDDLTDGRKFENIKDLIFSDYIDVDEFLLMIKAGGLPWERVDKIFHIGGISSTTEPDGKKVMHYNHYYTTLLYEASKIYSIPFIFTSSASVYGNCVCFRETNKPNPINLYALSKKMAEDYINRDANKNTYIFRPFNVYGSHEDHKDDQASPFSKFRKQVDETGVIKIFVGSAGIKRDFIWVGDVAKILVHHTKEGSGGTYNLGTGVAVSFKDIADHIAKGKGSVAEIPFPTMLANKYQYYSCADTTQLKTLIGDQYNFKSILDDEVMLLQ